MTSTEAVGMVTVVAPSKLELKVTTVQRTFECAYMSYRVEHVSLDGVSGFHFGACSSKRIRDMHLRK